ncbi:phosphopantetheine-binding protein [Desulfothermus naphthae]
MDVESALKEIIGEIMDIDPAIIHADTYLVRDLNMESIDLLELGVSINYTFNIDVDDDIAFLKDLRFNLEKLNNNSNSKSKSLLNLYPHLDRDRANEILEDLDNGPVLKFKDVVAYVKFIKNKG